LFYATDFADQLENIILPALKAGFIVLADRYIYTLMARDMVRGMDEAWLKNLYGIALEPDAVFIFPSNRRNSCSAISPKRDARLLGKRHGPGPVARHVRQLCEISDRDAGRVPALQKTYGFTIVDANRSVDSVTKELRKKIRALLDGE
jgi:dTMP kinase